MRIIMVAAVLAAFACTKKETPAPSEAEAPTAPAEEPTAPEPTAAEDAAMPAEEPADAAAAAPTGDTGDDPMGGKFTLEQATEGLKGKGKKLFARIKTSHGTINCELFPDKAPQTVASFVGLARGTRPWRDPVTREWVKKPFFEGLLFHRVIPNFMIQGGDVLSRSPDAGRVGTGDPGYSLPDEVAPDLKFDTPGRLAMANSGPGTNSGGSQFFITEVARPQLDGGYAIFGQCKEVDVVKKVARVERGGPEGSTPREPQPMNIEIYRK